MSVGVYGQPIWSPQSLYKTIESHDVTINRRRPTVPLPVYDYRRGVGDAKCMYEVMGGMGADENGPSMSMRDVCLPILANDPNTRMGDYLNCMGDFMQRGMDACGYSYQKDLRPSNCDQQRHPGFVNDVVNAPRYYYPSVDAYNAAWKHYSDLEGDGCGCWSKYQMAPGYMPGYGK